MGAAVGIVEQEAGDTPRRRLAEILRRRDYHARAPSVGTEQRVAGEAQFGHRVVPVLRRLHRLKIELVERAVDDFPNAHPRIGGGDAVLAGRDMRSDARRGWQECLWTLRLPWSPYH